MPMDGRTLRRFAYVAIACVMAIAVARHFHVHVRGAGGEDGETEPVRSQQARGDASPDAPRAAEVDLTNTDADPDMEARFGTVRMEVPGAATGIVFVGGRYIDAPYRLERRGLAIYLNDAEVERLEWPSRLYWRDDPPLPPGIHRDSQLADIRDWLFQKPSFYRSHFPPLEAIRKSLEAYHALPCVAHVNVSPSDVREGVTYWVIITLRSGETFEMVLRPVDLRPWPEEEVKRALKKRMEYWTRRLERDAIFVHVGVRLGLSTSAAPEIVAILQSDQSPHDKAAALMPLFQHFSDARILEERLNALLTQFEGSPQLDARVEMIRAKRERRARQ